MSAEFMTALILASGKPVWLVLRGDSWGFETAEAPNAVRVDPLPRPVRVRRTRRPSRLTVALILIEDVAAELTDGRPGLSRAVHSALYLIRRGVYELEAMVGRVLATEHPGTVRSVVTDDLKGGR